MRSDRQADGSNRCRMMVKAFQGLSSPVRSVTKLRTTTQTIAQIVVVGSWGMNDYVLSGSSCRNIRWNRNGGTCVYKQI